MDTVGSGHSRYCKKDEFNPARVEVDEVWGPAGTHRESPVAHSFRFFKSMFIDFSSSGDMLTYFYANIMVTFNIAQM